MRTRPLPRLALAILLSGLAGLALGTSWTGTAEAKRARGGAKAAPTGSADCKKDTDCVAAQDDCCSCNQGGKQHAIPKKDQAAYEKDRKKRCAAAGTECIEVMSQDPSCSQRPFCAAGICELGDAPAEGTP
jgi:hypothetical protein